MKDMKHYFCLSSLLLFLICCQESMAGPATIDSANTQLNSSTAPQIYTLLNTSFTIQVYSPEVWCHVGKVGNPPACPTGENLAFYAVCPSGSVTDPSTPPVSGAQITACLTDEAQCSSVIQQYTLPGNPPGVGFITTALCNLTLQGYYSSTYITSYFDPNFSPGTAGNTLSNFKFNLNNGNSRILRLMGNSGSGNDYKCSPSSLVIPSFGDICQLGAGAVIQY